MRAILSNDLVCPTYPGDFDVPIIGLQDRSRLELNGHTIVGGNIGVAATGARASIAGPGAINAMWSAGVLTHGRMSITDVTLESNFWGIHSPLHAPLKLTRVSVRNSIEYGITMGPSAIYSGKISGRDIAVTDNGRLGISGQNVVLRNVTVTGNRYSGVVGGAVRIRGGTVTGNGGEGFASFERVDIAGFRSLTTRDVTCGHSSNDVGVPWGVCELD